MSKIGTLQNALEDLFDECIPQFVNKKHSIQLQYKVEKNKCILVLTRIFRFNPGKALLKSAVYVKEEEDIDFLKSISIRTSPYIGSRVCVDCLCFPNFIFKCET